MDTGAIKLLIGSKLKRLRIANGYSSYETFAFENNIPRVQYWRMEKGTNFQLESLLRVLSAHQVSPEEFFKGIK